MEMSWIQIFVIAFGNIAWMLPVFFWVRSEARADARHADNLIRAIHEEMKDFHGRLCAIEAGKRKNTGEK